MSLKECAVCGDVTDQEAKKYIRQNEYYMLPLCSFPKCKNRLDADQYNTYLVMYLDKKRLKGEKIEIEHGVDEPVEETYDVYE